MNKKLSVQPLMVLLIPSRKNADRKTLMLNNGDLMPHMMVHVFKYKMSHITRKRVFGDFRPGNIQTSLLSYRS